MPFENFDLLISDPAIARVIGTPDGRTSDPVELNIDVGDLASRFENLWQRGNLADVDLIEFGKELFRTVMPEDIRDLFSQSTGIARAQSKILRLRLHLESAALMHLPWELLYSQGDFLAINNSYAICRYLPVDNPRLALPIELPLRILVVVSAPDEVPPLDYETEKGNIESGLETMLGTRSVELVYELEANREQLLRRMQNDVVHVLHFVGHGAYEADRGFIYLEGAGNRPDPIEGNQFAEILAASNTLQLVALNACSTAFEHAQRGFSSVASLLVRKGVPAVIAMRNAIDDRVAVAFSKHLYGTLAGGESVDVALTRTRQQLRQERGTSPVAFILPILHVSVPDALLFQVVSTRKKRLALVAQQIVQLSETSEAMGEWKELPLLHLLQDLSLVSQFANNPMAISLLPSVWAPFRQRLDGELVPFAQDHMRFIGQRYEQQEGVPTAGEEWAVRTVKIAGLIDGAIDNQSLPLLLEQIGQMRGLLLKYLPLCNRRMVSLLEQVTAAYQETRRILDELATRRPPGLAGLNWPAIQEDLSALDDRSERISEWITLHNLFDQLHLQFGVIAADATTTTGNLETLAEPWSRLRDTLVLTLLEQASQISHINQAAAGAAGGMVAPRQMPQQVPTGGELRAIEEIRGISQQLDSAIDAHDLSNTKAIILRLNEMIKVYYLRINLNVKDEMNDFTRRSFALQARVTP
jgi:hypothetical protein